MDGLTLDQINTLLDEKLRPIHSKLDEHGQLLKEHGETLDAITAELHEVHRLSSSTVDLLQLTREKFRPAINEARQRLGLPPVE